MIPKKPDIDKILLYVHEIYAKHSVLIEKEKFSIFRHYLAQSSKYWNYAPYGILLQVCHTGEKDGKKIGWNDEFQYPKKYGIIYNEDGFIYDVDINIYNENKHLFVADDFNLL